MKIHELFKINVEFYQFVLLGHAIHTQPDYPKNTLVVHASFNIFFADTQIFIFLLRVLLLHGLEGKVKVNRAKTTLKKFPQNNQQSRSLATNLLTTSSAFRIPLIFPVSSMASQKPELFMKMDVQSHSFWIPCIPVLILSAHWQCFEKC